MAFSVRTAPTFSIWKNSQEEAPPGPALFDETGRTPAGLAAYRGAIDDLDDLIVRDSRSHADAADLHKETPLHIAATYGHLDIVKMLVRDHGVAVDPVNWEGWTPLFCALSRSHVTVADYLLRHGANLRHTTPSGMTALHIASWFNQRDSAKLLLHKRELMYDENAYGVIPIGMARPGPVKRML
ncbi:hypothetical protein GPECTOR_65g180 [Gonium pectorale]|uniref:Uncharacterized protein n=1 Tax=Gonium pectorale TaxID=33097 RepID=A0A150G3W1_GONPE|nr:hypothetical protein GPECTOR_65g180 [Gonium pectorale]|eukprot:KXZ44562.1 hypothetical protein GPECTOR_65g180 [Gonium pectorale]